MHKKGNPFTRDRYKTRIGMTKEIYKPETFYKSKLVCYITTILFVYTDYSQMYTSFRGIMQATNMILLILTCVTIACVLDVPMAIAGYAMRGYKQGIITKKRCLIIFATSIIAFLLVYIPYVPFKLLTTIFIFEEGLARNTFLSSSVFLALNPLATSVGSFVINFFASNPKNDLLRRYYIAKIKIEANIMEATEAIAEIGGLSEYLNEQIIYEEKRYKNAIAHSNAMSLNMKQIARLEIAKKLNTPDDTNSIIYSSKNLNAREMKCDSDCEPNLINKLLTDVDGEAPPFKSDVA